MQAAHPRGRTAAHAETWRALLTGPVETIVDMLCSRSLEAAELRQTTPFAGILDDAERSSEVLGHASIAITKGVYGHLLGGEKQAATEAITGVLFSPSDEVTGSRRRTEDG